MQVEAKFTISLHSNPPNKESHIDLFIETADKPELYHYYLPLSEFEKQGGVLHTQEKEQNTAIAFYPGSWHRKMYMHYQGTISKGRGQLKILRQGKLSILLSLLNDYPQKGIRVLW